jgi:hypothetical protein
MILVNRLRLDQGSYYTMILEKSWPRLGDSDTSMMTREGSSDSVSLGPGVTQAAGPRRLVTTDQSECQCPSHGGYLRDIFSFMSS